MPPKAKFTREEIVSAAFEMVRADGIECLTARALGEKLGSSARPIFTVFGGMEEIRREVIAAATALYDGYVAKGLEEKLAFKGVGTAYIRFAAEEPKLFNLLFMKEKDAVTDKDSVLSVLDGNTEKIISSITDGYGLERDAARAVYFHSFVYCHGVATLISTGVCEFSESQISEMLTASFISFLKKIKESGSL